MKQSGYGKAYQYAHDHPGNFVEQEFLPGGLEKRVFYKPQSNAREQEIRQRLLQWWKNKYAW
jgi:putative ATPase